MVDSVLCEVWAWGVLAQLLCHALTFAHAQILGLPCTPYRTGTRTTVLSHRILSPHFARARWRRLRNPEQGAGAPGSTASTMIVSLGGAPQVSLPAASSAKVLLTVMTKKEVLPGAWTEDALVDFATTQVCGKVKSRTGSTMYTYPSGDVLSRPMTLHTLQNKMRRLVFSLGILRLLCDEGNEGRIAILRRLANSRFHRLHFNPCLFHPYGLGRPASSLDFTKACSMHVGDIVLSCQSYITAIAAAEYSRSAGAGDAEVEADRPGKRRAALFIDDESNDSDNVDMETKEGALAQPTKMAATASIVGEWGPSFLQVWCR